MNASSPPGWLPALVQVLSEIFNIRGGYEPGRYRARLAFALTLSLLIHALILSLRFGLAGVGLPGFGMPWAERRVEVPSLTVRLVPAPAAVPRAAAAPVRPRAVEPERMQPAPALPSPPVAAVPEAVQPPPAPRAETRFVARPPVGARSALQPLVAAPVTVRPRARAAPKQPRPEIIAQAEPRQETFTVPPPSPGDPEKLAAPVVEAPPEIPEPTVQEVAAKPQVEEPLPAKEPEQPAQTLREEEAARRAQEQEAKRQEEIRRQDEARKREQANAERGARELEAKLKADEAARQQAAALARQKELEARRQEEARRLEEATRKQEEAKRQEEARRLEEAKQQDEASAQRLALELEAKRKADEAARQQADEAAKQQAAALARQKELEALRQDEARKLEEARREEEARRLEEAKKQEEARAQRLAQELEAKQKADDAVRRKAEEAARQQAEALARQKELEARRQAEELAARARAQELADRQRAEALAAAQRARENERAGTGGAAPSGSTAAAPRTGGEGSAPAAPPGRLSGSQLASKAIEQLRSPGALRAEPPGPRSFPRGADNPRRGSIFGSVQTDVGLRMYAESWRWKIERNGGLNIPASARTKPHENPIVTVAIRSDGSVEEVFIHRSSGLRELDEAVRRIVHLLAPYGAFPPDMARQFDVIEIRRIWFFTDRLNVLEDER